MSAENVVLFADDFKSFPIGPFPFDREHSAMGEYHCVRPEGYVGQWYDPIANCWYRGPSWIVTARDGVHYMEQTRVRNPLTNGVCPVLTAGETDWTDYTVSVKMRALRTDEEAGLLFRYQTSLAHYAFFLKSGEAQLWRINKTERTLLQSAPMESYDCDTYYTLSVRCKGADFACAVNGQTLIKAHDELYASGKIALSAYMPAQFTDVLVEATPEENAALIARRDAAQRVLDAKKLKYAHPKLWKTYDFADYGASRQIRFGHLMGGDDWYFILAQHQKRVYKERYCNISCLTAVSVETGKVLWQRGEPSPLAVNQDTTCDLPMQIYDINNDGIDEVIVASDFEVMILDGRTGETLRSMKTPYNDDPADEILGIEFKKHAFDRLNVDAIRIVNVSGKERPSDILIKDRYARIWIFDSDFNLLWKFIHNNTGHFPYAYDFNGDGKDEIFSCYNMISSDGKLVWELPIATDHTDEIVIGPIDPDKNEDLIAIVSGWEGFMLVDTKGNILARDINGHAQRISVANYCPDIRGLQICTTTYWENMGILYLFDCKGREIWHKEPKINGNVIAPVNWQGDGTELILLNGDPVCGGMMDGDGDTVVLFPDDGHPTQCAEAMDLTGDARDEIILWDARKMYIYTQDRPAADTEREYIPDKYPCWSASNYRGEFSFPRWRDKK